MCSRPRIDHRTDASLLGANRHGYELTGIHCQGCGHDIVFSVQDHYELLARGSIQRFCDPACRCEFWVWRPGLNTNRAMSSGAWPSQREGKSDVRPAKGVCPKHCVRPHTARPLSLARPSLVRWTPIRPLPSAHRPRVPIFRRCTRG